MATVEGIVRRYQPDALDVPIADLHRFLARKPEHLAHVNPLVFEDLIASCLKAAFNPCEVIKIGGSKDRGIDLVLVRTNELPYLVQVKRRSNLERSEGVDVVRLHNGVLFREGIPRGMIVTTAKAFTKSAHSEREVKTGTSEPYELELFARGHIIEWLRLDFPEPYCPWRSHIPPSHFTEDANDDPVSGH